MSTDARICIAEKCTPEELKAWHGQINNDWPSAMRNMEDGFHVGEDNPDKWMTLVW